VSLTHALADSHDRLALARLVAARHDYLRVARRRDGKIVNEYRRLAWGQFGPVHDPYAVHLARDGQYYTLAFDLDARGVLDPAADAGQIRALLTASGINFIEATSGPTGGRHLIARFDDPLPADLVQGLATHLRSRYAPSLDPSPLCNPRTGALRPPGSPHRSGGRSTLVTPLPDAYQALQAGNRRDAFDRLYSIAGVPTVGAGTVARAAPRVPRPLSKRIRQLEICGDESGEFRDRSSLAAAICLGYVNAGRPVEEFVEAALDASRLGLDHLRRVRTDGGFRHRNHAEIRSAAMRMWNRRTAFATAYPIAVQSRASTDTQYHVDAILRAMESVPQRWGGQGGTRDRAVLASLLDLVLRTGILDIAASHRSMAERSGLTRSAAGRAFQRLVSDGWLVKVTESLGINAAIYRAAIPGLADVAVVGSLNPAPLTSESLHTAVVIRTHDALSTAGLGRYSASVMVTLLAGPMPESEVAARTGLSARTVRRCLTRLAEHGLATESCHTWSIGNLSLLDEVAKELNVVGESARRAATHAEERQTYHWYLADRAARHGWAMERGSWPSGSWYIGTGATRRSVPSIPYPRTAGRADYRRALRMVNAAHGPALENLAEAVTQLMIQLERNGCVSR
jgi:hypothetical protein